MKQININNIPSFKDEGEEAEFWQTHELDDESLNQMKHVTKLSKKERQKAARRKAADCLHINKVQIYLDDKPMEYCLNCLWVFNRSVPIDHIHL